MQSQNSLSVQQLIAVLIQAGSIQSLNYNPAGPAPFALAGTRIDLTNGDMKSTALFVDGATGNLSVKGLITATGLSILHPTLGYQAMLLSSAGYIIANTPALQMLASSGEEVAALAWMETAANVEQLLLRQISPTAGRLAGDITMRTNDTGAGLDEFELNSNAGQIRLVYNAAAAPPGVITIAAFGAAGRIVLTAASLGAWTAVPASGANYGNAGGAWQVSQYRKVGDMVQVRMELLSTGVNAANSVITTLPAGFRPPADQRFLIVKAAGASAPITVNAAGQIIDQAGTAGAGVPLSVWIQFYTSA